MHQPIPLRDRLGRTARREDPMTTSLTIANTGIRQDEHGRFCLTDLHKASGGAARHALPLWQRSSSVGGLVEELAKDTDSYIKPIHATKGRCGGTYAVKELVYAYAMWISPKFHLAVIRAYDQMVKYEQMP